MKRTILLLLISLFALNSYGQTVTVTDWDGLKKAINDNTTNVVTINAAGDLIIKESLTISKDITINSTSKAKLVADESLNGKYLFTLSDQAKKVTFKNISFDGKEKSGIINIPENTAEYSLALRLEACDFLNASSSTGGAAIHSKALVDIYIDDSKFTNNKTTENGGAIFFDCSVNNNALIEANNTAFELNQANKDGGAIYVKGNATLNIFGGTLSKNTAGSSDYAGNGGAIYSGLKEEANKAYFIQGSKFTENEATGLGGAIYAENTGFVISGTTPGENKDSNLFSKNKAALKGGAMYVSTTTSAIRLSVSNSEFAENEAGQSGGAIYVTGNTSGFSVAACKFENNKQTDAGSETGGGAIAVVSETTEPTVGNVTVQKVDFLNNTAETDGGAIYLSGMKKAKLTGSTFENNTAKQYTGGAIYLIAKYEEVGGARVYSNIVDDEHEANYEQLELNKITFKGNKAGLGMFNFERNKFEKISAVYDAFVKGIISVSEPDASTDDHAEPTAYNNYDVSFVNYFTIAYNGNQNSSGTVPVDGSLNRYEAEVIVLEYGDLVKGGYELTEWNTKADGKGTSYKPGDKINITESLTLYAQWLSTEEPVVPPTVYHSVDLIAPYLTCYTYSHVDGGHDVESGSCFTFDINCEIGCKPNCTFEVYVYPGGELISPKDSSDLKITYELCDIQENRVIEVKPICDCCSVGNEELDVKERIWAGAGNIFVENLSPDVVRIYNMNGQTVYDDKLPQGQHAIPVAKGLYIVRLGDYREGVKVMVSDF